MKFGKTVLALCILLFCAVFTLSAEALKPYKVSSANEINILNSVSMAGDSYTDGYTNNGSPTVLLFNLKNKYRVMTCLIGPTDSAEIDRKCIFRFYVDQVLVDTITLTGEEFPQEVTVDLNYQRQLKIEMESRPSGLGTAGTGKLAVCNIDFR